MVNWVEVQKPLLHGLVKLAGLRLTTVELDDGTVMSVWVPKHKLSKSKNKNNIAPEVKGGNAAAAAKENKTRQKKQKPAVVLVHGFAAEGIVTWQFQVGALTSKYDVYVPDLIFFGGSTSASEERSPEFQARCVAAAVGRLGVQRCAIVGFSYGGMVAFKLAEMRPELVHALIVSGSVIAMTDSISDATLARLGFSSSSELLLPESVKGLRALFSVATYKKLWFPDCLHKDYLKVMFSNRKERAELLEGLVISNKETTVPNLPQKILLLWGENDNIFNIELAMNMKEQLGEKTTLQGIKKAGHLVHLERPCVYNRHLKDFLAFIHAEGSQELSD